MLSVFIGIVLVFPCSGFPDFSYSNLYDTHKKENCIHVYKKMELSRSVVHVLKKCSSRFEALKGVLLGYTRQLISTKYNACRGQDRFIK